MALRKRDFRSLSIGLTIIMLLLLGLFGLGACGDNEAAPAGNGADIDEAAVAEMDMAGFLETLTEAVQRLVERHGGDEAAFCAVFVALDQGYDTYQLLTGALNDRLEGDGRIMTVDGSVLAPSRPAGGITVPPDGGAGGDTGGGATDSTTEPLLLASLSMPLLTADSSGPSAKIPVWLSDRLRTLADVYDHFTEVRTRIRELQKQEIQEEEKRKKQAAALAREFETKVLTELAARGYSAEQIAQAAVLMQTKPEYREEIDAYIWDCMHTSGQVLQPAHEPVMISSGPYGPTAGADAPATYDRDDIEAALAGGEGGATPGGEGAGPSDEPATTTTEVKAINTPPVAEDIITSTTPGEPVAITLKGSDVDGDELTYAYEQPANGVAEGAPPFLTYTPEDGLAGATDVFTYRVNDGEADSEIATVRIEVEALRYQGEVGVLSQPPLPVYRLDYSNVELLVSGNTVTVTLEFTLVAVLKWDSDDYLCTATMHRVYRGEGPWGESVSIELTLVDSSDVLEGPDQAGVTVPVVQSQLLEGTFSDDGTFDGNIRNAWAVGAARVN